MSALQSKRCPHYQLYSESLGLDGPSAFLAIRRCLLSERLIGFLAQVPDGAQLADKLRVTTAAGKAYAVIGPDLEAVTQHTCTVERCNDHCTPAYKSLLNRFGVIDPGEETVTCDDEDDATENAPATNGTDKSEPCPSA